MKFWISTKDACFSGEYMIAKVTMSANEQGGFGRSGNGHETVEVCCCDAPPTSTRFPNAKSGIPFCHPARNPGRPNWPQVWIKQNEIKLRKCCAKIYTCSCWIAFIQYPSITLEASQGSTKCSVWSWLSKYTLYIMTVCITVWECDKIWTNVI